MGQGGSKAATVGPIPTYAPIQLSERGGAINNPIYAQKFMNLFKAFEVDPDRSLFPDEAITYSWELMSDLRVIVIVKINKTEHYNWDFELHGLICVEKFETSRLQIAILGQKLLRSEGERKEAKTIVHHITLGKAAK